MNVLTSCISIYSLKELEVRHREIVQWWSLAWQRSLPEIAWTSYHRQCHEVCRLVHADKRGVTPYPSIFGEGSWNTRIISTALVGEDWEASPPHGDVDSYMSHIAGFILMRIRWNYKGNESLAKGSIACKPTSILIHCHICSYMFPVKPSIFPIQSSIFRDVPNSWDRRYLRYRTDSKCGSQVPPLPDGEAGRWWWHPSQACGVWHPKIFNLPSAKLVN